MVPSHDGSPRAVMGHPGKGNDIVDLHSPTETSPSLAQNHKFLITNTVQPADSLSF